MNPDDDPRIRRPRTAYDLDRHWWPAPTREEWRQNLTPGEYRRRQEKLCSLARRICGETKEPAPATFAGKARAAGGDS